MAWLARLALVLLALAASYGVYTFQRLFVPQWVALVSAAAFEATYIALAFVRGGWRASAIGVTSVVVSVLYNSLAALFERRPALLTGAPLWADALLAALHGAPLAFVAYNVASLLHDAPAPTDGARTPWRMRIFGGAQVETAAALPAHDAPVVRALPADVPARPAHVCRRCGAQVESQQRAAASARWGCAQCKEMAS